MIETPHIKEYEYRCHCGCGFNSISPGVLYIVEMARGHFGGKRVLIISGCRCPKQNARTPGAAPHSQHRPQEDGLCHALDVYYVATPLLNVYNYFDRCMEGFGGVGIYNEHIHIDDRLNECARWDARKEAD